MGVQNEVEAQKHSWNVKKVGQWGRGLDGEGSWEKIARSGKVEQSRTPITLAVSAGLAYTARPSLSSSFALAVEVSPGRPREIS